MSSFARTDISVVGRWWWTVDRWSLGGVALLIAAGTVLTLAASPAVAERLGLESYHFVQRQFLFLVPALVLIFAISLMPPVTIRRLAALAFAGGLVLIVMTLLTGTEINGAKRWLPFWGFALQPSEFLKPAFVVVTAWMLAEGRKSADFPGMAIAAGLLAAVCSLLLLQPDFGQVILIGSVWLAQVFIAGLPWIWVAATAALGVAVVVGAYFLLPHVASRVDRFFDPAAGDTYQIDTALDAFVTGGLFGQGPGEGVVKRVLPDAHTDFIFAVAGEEFGLIVCLMLVALFAFVVLRGFARLMAETDHFVQLAGTGLLVLFGLQAVINLGVNLDLLPAKGMTLPFISYGGSSLLALAMTMGMLLGLTRDRVRQTPRLERRI